MLKYNIVIFDFLIFDNLVVSHLPLRQYRYCYFFNFPQNIKYNLYHFSGKKNTITQWRRINYINQLFIYFLMKYHIFYEYI